MVNISTSGNNYIKIIIASISLIIGGLIYVVFRSESLIMFSWFDKLGLSESISVLREIFGNKTIYSWLNYNMPAALWLFAYMYVIDAIWNNFDNAILYKPFFWLMPIIAILSEFLQLLDLMPGTFDILDLLSYLFSVIIYFSLNKINP